MKREKSNDHLRYPIGKWNESKTISPVELKKFIAEIKRFPSIIEKQITGLTVKQMNNKYRIGGWTIRQIVNHLADSHGHAFFRFKYTLTEKDVTIKPYMEAQWCALPDCQLTSVTPVLMMLKGIHIRWAELMSKMKPSDWQKKYYHPKNNREYTLKQALEMYVWHSRHHKTHIELAKKT